MPVSTRDGCGEMQGMDASPRGVTVRSPARKVTARLSTGMT